MKSLHFISVTLLSLSLFAGCSNNPEEMDVSQERSIEASAEQMQADKRVGFDRQMKFYWSKQDKIGVTTDAMLDMFSSMNIKTGGGTSNATFKGTLTGNIGTYAVYPFSFYHYVEGTTLYMDMPLEYTYAKVDPDFFLEDQGSGNSFNTPMWSTISSGRIDMKHLGSVFCVKLLEMPIGDNIQIVLDAGRQRLSGEFAADLSQPTPIIETANATEATESKITITFSNHQAKTPGVFYFPIPVGTYKMLYIHVVNGAETTDAPLGRNIVIKRNTLKKFELKDGAISTGGDGAIVESKKDLSFDSKSQTFEIKIKAGAKFTVQDPAVEWIHRAESADANLLKYTVDENTTHESRNAEIVITNTANQAKETVKILQMQKDAIVIAKTNYELDNKGGDLNLTVGHNVDFDTNINVDWITQVTTRAFVEETLQFNIKENTTDASREGKITFTSKDGSIKQEVSVKQTSSSIIVYIPDLYFKSILLLDYDMNKDSEISSEEAATIKTLTVANVNIRSLEGIQYMINLENLDCTFSRIKTLNLSNLTKLHTLNCKECSSLTSLDVSGCTSLTLLEVDGKDFMTKGNLCSLKVGGCTALTSLDCHYNQLTTLDVSGCTALTSLDCSSNQLTTLDVSGCAALTSLQCEVNLQLTTLDLSHNTSLTQLECYRNQLTTLDVSGCTALTNLSCADNQLTTLDVSHNTALTVLRCGENQLTTLDVSHNTALTLLRCEDNQLTTLDVSHNTALNSLYCPWNQLTTLDISKNTLIDELYIPMDNKLETLYVWSGFNWSSLSSRYKDDNTKIIEIR